MICQTSSEKAINSIDKNQAKGIKSIISSYSNNDLDIAKSKTKWFNNNLFIDKITISGSIKSLNLIINNKRIKSTIKTSELTNLLQIEKEFKQKQLLLENKINTEIKKVEDGKAKSNSIQNKSLTIEEKDQIKKQITEIEIKSELDKLNINQQSSANI